MQTMKDMKKRETCIRKKICLPSQLFLVKTTTNICVYDPFYKQNIDYRIYV